MTVISILILAVVFIVAVSNPTSSKKEKQELTGSVVVWIVILALCGLFALFVNKIIN